MKRKKGLKMIRVKTCTRPEKKKKLAKLHTYNNVAGKWNMFALKKHASPVMMKEVELPDMLLGYVLLL